MKKIVNDFINPTIANYSFPKEVIDMHSSINKIYHEISQEKNFYLVNQITFNLCLEINDEKIRIQLFKDQEDLDGFVNIQKKYLQFYKEVRQLLKVITNSKNIALIKDKAVVLKINKLLDSIKNNFSNQELSDVSKFCALFNNPEVKIIHHSIDNKKTYLILSESHGYASDNKIAGFINQHLNCGVLENAKTFKTLEEAEEFVQQNHIRPYTIFETATNVGTIAKTDNKMGSLEYQKVLNSTQSQQEKKSIQQTLNNNEKETLLTEIEYYKNCLIQLGQADKIIKDKIHAKVKL